jgi:general stress protein 26
MDTRKEAANAYVLALRSGEFSAVEYVSKFLARDVVLTGVAGKAGPQVEGFEGVLHRVSGRWPNTAVYSKAYWSEPSADGDRLKVQATFPPMGSSPQSVELTFSFNAEGQISQIDQKITPQPPVEPSTVIPDAARGMINGALANNTPLSIAYADENGKIHQSIRGGTQVYSPTQIAIWVRNKESSLPRAMAKNPNVALLYRDNLTRSTLMIQGEGHIETGEETCKRVWDMIPDVEQKHETRESGCALIIEVESIAGNSPAGGIRMQRGA